MLPTTTHDHVCSDLGPYEGACSGPDDSTPCDTRGLHYWCAWCDSKIREVATARLVRWCHARTDGNCPAGSDGDAYYMCEHCVASHLQ
jgi:hypothetical protein